MRPIDKGRDQGSFKCYGDAQQPLKAILGEYCSYCERWVSNAIHVEHKLPKNDYPGRRHRWTNFLLSCSNCNSGKSSGKLRLKDFLWPDSDNTFYVFIYDKDGRVTVKNELPRDILLKAKNMWKLVGLNRHPDVGTTGMERPTVKDDRWIHRRQEWICAAEKKNDLRVLDTPERRDMVARDALRRGMFSVWMTVFEDDRDMRKRIIEQFKGTATNCFNKHTHPVRRQGGQI